MKQITYSYHRFNLILLALSLMGLSFSTSAMKQDTPAGNPNQAAEAFWHVLFERSKQAGLARPGQTVEEFKHEKNERLRLSAINRGMRAWQTDEESEPTCLAKLRDEEAPKPAQAQLYQTKLDGRIDGMVIVPYTSKVLLCIHNKLRRIDVTEKKEDFVAFSQPITGLVPSSDGSLCAVLLEPKKDCYPEIRCINPSKSKLEINKEIEPIPYYCSDEYEIGQEADFSPDARFLATISSPCSVCIHRLQTNTPHAIIMKNESEFPIFSVHFLKNKSCESALACEKHKLAVHSNMLTSVHEVTDAGCTELYRINHKNNAATCGLDYAPRQGAWLLPDGYVVRISNIFTAYNCAKKETLTFKVSKNSIIKPCPNNPYMFLECRKKEKDVRLYDLQTMVMKKFSCDTAKEMHIDDSPKLMVMAQNDNLFCMIKPDPVSEKKE